MGSKFDPETGDEVKAVGAGLPPLPVVGLETDPSVVVGITVLLPASEGDEMGVLETSSVGADVGAAPPVSGAEVAGAETGLPEVLPSEEGS